MVIKKILFQLTWVVILLAVNIKIIYSQEIESINTKLMTFNSPIYGPLSVASNTQGKVIIEVIINKQGNVIQEKVIEGPQLLLQNSESAIKSWRFNESNSEYERKTIVEINYKILKESIFASKTEAKLINNCKIEVTHTISTISPLNLKYLEIYQKCPVHNEEFKLDIVPIIYGLPEQLINYPVEDIISFFKNLKANIKPPANYYKDRQKSFPYSNLNTFGGCDVRYESKEEVIYCELCRKQEIKWRKKHHKDGISIVARVE